MNLLDASIGWVAPATCVGCGTEGASICELCAVAEIIPYGERCAMCGKLSLGCASCQACKRQGAPKHIWVTTHYDGLAKEALRIYKYGHCRAAAQDLAGQMVETLTNYADIRPSTLVVPVPTASSRVRQRGFDHAALLAKQVAAGAGLQYCSALSRLGQARQVGAKRSARLAQQAGQYIVREPKIKGQNILLVDDVITTGATLGAVYKTLRAAGAKNVDALVFAKRL